MVFLLKNKFSRKNINFKLFSMLSSTFCLIFAFVILGAFNGNAGVEKVLETFMVLTLLALIMQRYH